MKTNFRLNNCIRKARFLGITCIFLFGIFTANAQEKKKNTADAIFNADFVHTIEISFLQCAAWDTMLANREKMLLNPDSSIYLQANVTLNGEKFYAAGVRFKGESSYQFMPGRKKSFKIKFNEFIKGQKPHGISVLNLINGFRDPTFLREKLYFGLMEKENIPAPRIAFANLNINGENFGLYVLSEQIGSVFLENHFGNSKGSFYKGEPQATFEFRGTSPDDYIMSFIPDHKEKKIRDDLVNLVAVINDTTLDEETQKAELDKLLNTSNCLKVFAITNLLCNVDAYNMKFPHNFYLYRNESNQKFEWLPYDGNYAFCAWSPDLSYAQAEKLSIFYDDPNLINPLFDLFLNNSIYRAEYIAYIDQLTNRFAETDLERTVDSLALKIRKNVYLDPLKMYSNDEFEKNLTELLGDPADPGAFIPGLTSFWITRQKNVQKEIRQIK